MAHFVVKKVTDVENLKEGDIIPESDFASLTPGGKFFQLEYKEEEQKLEPFIVKPGIWAIKKTMAGLKLYETSFTKDEVLESFVQTKEVTDKIDSFFKRLHVYAKRGIEIPIRRMLLYGSAGTGKSTAISLAARKYAADAKTAVVIWHTDKFEAFQVKDFIKSFSYEGVEKVILIAEDIGGSEMAETRRPSESSLLSLLDNQEKTFTIPTMIIATTNHPEIFLGSLTNRPGRFADKIEVGFPPPKARQELLRFFSRGEEITQELNDLIAANDCAKFTADHLKEIFLRADLYEKTPYEVTREMVKELKTYEKAFQSGNTRMGFSIED